MAFQTLSSPLRGLGSSKQHHTSQKQSKIEGVRTSAGGGLPGGGPQAAINPA